MRIFRSTVFMGFLSVIESIGNSERQPKVTVSIVSHGQGALVETLLKDMVNCSGVDEIVVTYNIPEPDVEIPAVLSDSVRVIRNDKPKGFGANHNQAFEQCSSPYFLVLNPDIRLDIDPFPELLSCFAISDGTALVVPAVKSSDGKTEDSRRHFPTPWGIAGKLFGLNDGRYPDVGDAPRAIEWAAGMFMFFRSEIFEDLRGFDDGYFLYYEDVDICTRLWNSGYRVIACPNVVVVHDAQRESHRNLRFLKWHLTSMARYFLKHTWRLPQIH